MTAGEKDEGVSAYIGNAVTVFSENTITIDMFGSAKYRNYKYGADDHIAIVHTEHLKKQAAIFITSAIHKSSYTGEFNYGRNFYAKDADALTIQLPINSIGDVDYEFMENFIAELEADRILALEAYLAVTGLKDYTLTAEEQQALNNYEDLQFAKIKIIDLFNVKNTGNILGREIKENSGSTPYLCASAENNAVSSYISYELNFLEKGECVFIGGKTFVVTYQEEDFYSNDSHNLVLHHKDDSIRARLNQLYFVTCINKSMKHKYSWGDSISSEKIKKDEVFLPVKNEKIYYESMKPLISAMQKIIIKDVVNYTNQKINLEINF